MNDLTRNKTGRDKGNAKPIQIRAFVIRHLPTMNPESFCTLGDAHEFLPPCLILQTMTNHANTTCLQGALNLLVNRASVVLDIIASDNVELQDHNVSEDEH